MIAAESKSPKSSDWLHLADTGNHRVGSSRRIPFVKNSSDKSQGYFTVGDTGRYAARVDLTCPKASPHESARMPDIPTFGRHGRRPLKAHMWEISGEGVCM